MTQQEIKPRHVTSEQAKLLKGKGFNVECLCFYCINTTCNYIDKPYKYSFEVNANQENFVNGKLDNFGYGETYSAPEQWQVVEWLRVNHGIWIFVERGKNLDLFYPVIDTQEKIISFKYLPLMWGNSPQEAYSAAFNYTLKNLL